MNERDAIVEEALSWVGTPYHHMADVKGSGVDCAMILVKVFKKFGKLPEDLDPRPYPMQWHLHRDAERYLDWFTSNATRVEHGQPGDVALFKFGRTVSHSGIILPNHQMVHAFRDAGMVIVEPISAHAERFHSYWSVF